MISRTSLIPLWVKVPYTVFLCVQVPVYWIWLGPENFLWASDIALFVTLAALWLESRLLVSMMTLAVLLPELLWNVDFFGRLLGGDVLGASATVYMFDQETPLFVRGLSLFHVVLPVLLLWMLFRLGYDKRALPAQTLLAWIVLPISYWFTEPAKNINWVFGLGQSPQELMPGIWYLLLMMVLLPLLVYLPTHWLLQRLFKGLGRPA